MEWAQQERIKRLRSQRRRRSAQVVKRSGLWWTGGVNKPVIPNRATPTNPTGRRLRMWLSKGSWAQLWEETDEQTNCQSVCDLSPSAVLDDDDKCLLLTKCLNIILFWSPQHTHCVVTVHILLERWRALSHPDPRPHYADMNPKWNHYDNHRCNFRNSWSYYLLMNYSSANQLHNVMWGFHEWNVTISVYSPTSHGTIE